MAQAWWIRVTVGVGEAELAADRLWALGTVAVEESKGELRAGFPDRGRAERAAAALRSRWPVVAGVDDGTWRSRWRAHAGPVTVGRVMIRPTWDGTDGAVPPGVSVIRIDPGEVFGSGHHASTQLCLGALQGQGLTGRSVLDLGCGSGVLAVVAASLGAGPVVALDLDPAAAEVTLANAALNTVAIFAVVGPVEGVRGHFDVIVANLGGALAPAGVAPELVRRLAPSGVIIIGGTLSGQQALVRSAYVPLVVHAEEEKDGWVVMTLRREPRPRP